MFAVRAFSGKHNAPPPRFWPYGIVRYFKRPPKARTLLLEIPYENSARHRWITLFARCDALRRRVSRTAEAARRPPARSASAHRARSRAAAASARKAADSCGPPFLVGAGREAAAGARTRDGTARSTRHSDAGPDPGGRGGRLRP